MPDIIDTLEIQVSADTKKARSEINKLAKTLSKLETTVNGLTSTKLLPDTFKDLMTSMTGVSTATAATDTGMKALGKTLASTSKLGADGFNNLNKALGKVSKTASGIKLGKISTGLSGSLGGLSGIGRSSGVGGVANLGRTFTKSIISARAFIAVIKSLWRAMGDGIDLASDLVEVQNVVDKAFGNEAYKVEELVSTSIQQLGMSELTAKQVSSRFQAMGSAMGISGGAVKKASSQIGTLREGYNSTAESMADMSLNLTRLSADMASFYNVEVSEVAEDLNAVFTGQTRPLMLAA